ncbi:unnamed protein product [Blepharisma stoltei]|uniref:PAS domain-containing protein n=1 Tax=Blepharisma stoltei TaxID=1481888 RepID=A0AAU9IQ53_9CILI|nr:unnamed protein product [Blepharisma stoltei]
MPIRQEVFNFLYKLQNNAENPETVTSVTALLKLTILKIVFTSQFASIAWDQKSPNNWNSIDAFWNIIGYMRFDNILSDLGIIEWFLYLALIVVWCYYIILLSLYFLLRVRQKIPHLLWKLESALRALIFEFCYIPITFSFIISIKYLIFYYDRNMKEYQNKKLNPSMINCLPLFTLTVFSLMIFNYIYEIFIYEHRHSYASSSSLTKAHSYTSKIKIISFDLILFYLAFYDPLNIIYLRVFLFLAASLNAFVSVYYAAYFNQITNFLDTSSTLFVLITSVSLIIGDIQNSQSTGLVLFLFLNPVSICFLYIITKFRYSKLSKQDLQKQCRDIYEFERVTRCMLIDKKSDKDQVLGIFANAHENYQLNTSRLLSIWEAEYCFYILYDSRLASIRLGCRYPWKKSGFEDEYLEFCLRSQLFNDLFKYQYDIKFLMRLEKLEDWKKLDKKFCISLNQIIGLIYTNNCSIPKIYPAIKIMNDKFDILRDDYKEISKNSEANQTFYRSLSDKSEFENSDSIFKNNKKTQLDMNSVTKRYNKGNYNEDTNGIIIISGCRENIGVILYANLNAAKILRETTYNIIDSDINEYIPHPFNTNHKAAVENFIKHSISSDIEHSNETYLRRKSGFLIEISLTLTCASLNKHPFFLFLFKEINENYPKCLLDERGLVIGFSENFPFILNLPSKSLIYKSIFDFNLQIERKGCIIENSLNETLNKEIEIFQDNDFIRLFFDGKSFPCQFYKKRNCNKFLNILIILKEENKGKEILQNFDTFLYDKSLHLNFISNNKNHDKVSFFDDVNHSTDINEEKSKISNEFNTHYAENDAIKKPANTSLSWYLSKHSGNDTYWWKLYISKIKRQFSIYKWLLFLCIIILLATSGAILGYALSETNKANNINALTETGLIIDTMISISGHAVRMDISTYNNATVMTITQGYAKINNFTNSLKLMTKQMLTELPSWDYCPWFTFYRDEEIPMWNTIGKYKIVMKNFVDIIQTYEDIATDFLHKISHNESYEDDLNFLILNSMGILAHKTDYILNILTSCEHYRTQQLTDAITWLVATANIILGFCAFVLICIIFIICYNLKKFYSEIAQKIKNSYGGLHNKLITRLSDFYGYDYEIMKDLPISLQTSNWFEDDYLRLLSKISIYFLITFAFYLLFYFYAYRNGEDYLLSRPDVIALLIKRQIFGRIISFWARVYVFQDTTISIYNKLSDDYFFSNPENEYWKLAGFYKDWKLPLLSNNVQNFFSSELRTMMFEKLDVTDAFAQYGASACQDEQITEMNYLFNSVRNMKTYSSILVRLDNIRNVLNVVNNQMLLMTTDYSTQLIQENFEIFTWLTVVYVVFSLLIYFLFYLPNIFKEMKRLEVLKKFCKLI